MSDDDLQRRIDAARRADESRDTTGLARAPLARGLTMASEFVCAILVGAGLGWVIDRFTVVPAPLAMIAGAFIGFAAGVTMIVRSGTGSVKPSENL